MDKELDPLRELKQASEDEPSRDLPPTIQFVPTEIRGAADAKPVSEKDYTYLDETPVGQSSPMWPVISSPSSPSSSRSRVSAASRIAINERIAGRPHVRTGGAIVPIATLFMLGIVVAVLGIAVFQEKTTTGSHVNRINAEDPAPTPLPESQSYIAPLFGEFAVKKCNERCLERSAGKDACVRGCRMYGLEQYGRRITFDKFDPSLDAVEISNRCTKIDMPPGETDSSSAWYDNAREDVKLLETATVLFKSNDLSKSKLLYGKLLDVNARVKIPAAASTGQIEFAKNMLRSSCLSANVALAQIGINTADKNSDQFSARYYRQVMQGVEPKAIDAANLTIAEARSLRLQ